MVILNSLEYDVENICPICETTREYLGRYGKKFSDHIEQDHYFWSYCYYLTYLVNKPESERSGEESTILGQFNSKKAYWVPRKGMRTEMERLELVRKRNESMKMANGTQ